MLLCVFWRDIDLSWEYLLCRRMRCFKYAERRIIEAIIREREIPSKYIEAEWAAVRT